VRKRQKKGPGGLRFIPEPLNNSTVIKQRIATRSASTAVTAEIKVKSVVVAKKIGFRA
jgi:hypothetical protein